MSRKKPTPGKTPQRSPHVALYVRVAPDLADALNDYLDDLRPRPDRQAVIITALEDYLQRLGYWPRGQPQGP